MPRNDLSGRQLEKLGDRLRDGPLTLADLRHLRRFLETLEPFAKQTFATITAINNNRQGLRAGQMTRRNIKTTRSILAKLRRQSTTLPQIQDLIGCRIVVPDVMDQDLWREKLQQLFPEVQLTDRRNSPQHGYRAVHGIVRQGNQRFEVQLRTLFQDEWANFVEKIDDRLGLSLKYGAQEPAITDTLQELSESYAKLEQFQLNFQARIHGESTPTGKLLIGTFLGDYYKALQDASSGRRLSPFSVASKEAESYARSCLRLMLWTNVEVSLGAQLLIGSGPSAAAHVSVLSKSSIAANDAIVAAATVDHLRGGRLYEITQPADAERYFLFEETFGDMITDAEVGRTNLANMLKIED